MFFPIDRSVFDQPILPLRLLGNPQTGGVEKTNETRSRKIATQVCAEFFGEELHTSSFRGADVVKCELGMHLLGNPANFNWGPFDLKINK